MRTPRSSTPGWCPVRATGSGSRSRFLGCCLSPPDQAGLACCHVKSAIGVPKLASSDPTKGVEVLGVGVGEGVEVFLGGGDLGVSHAVHHGFEVGTTGTGHTGNQQCLDSVE